jgi:hypothetical protein
VALDGEPTSPTTTRTTQDDAGYQFPVLRDGEPV